MSFLFFFGAAAWGREKGASLTGALAKWQFSSQKLLLKHQSRSDAKSIMLMLVPAAVCYLIFRQSLTLLSDLWGISSGDPEQIYHMHTHIPALVWR